MKTKVTILMVLLTFTLGAQVRFGAKENFLASVYVDPGASQKENGLDIGMDLEYRGPVYAKIGLESFEVLPGNYFDIHAAVGPRITIGENERLAIYSGLRGGVVFRYSNPNPILGFEFGADYTFKGGLLIGLNGSTIKRGDIEKLYNEEDFWRGNFYARIGYSWDW